MGGDGRTKACILPRPKARKGAASSGHRADGTGQRRRQRGREERLSRLAFAGVVQQSRIGRHDRALPRTLSQLRPHHRGTAIRSADHRHCPDRQRSFPVQPPPPRARQPRARRHSRGGRHSHRISAAPDPGNRQAAHRRPRSQPGLSWPGGSAVRLSARWRGADHRLRQDHPGGLDGGGHGQHSGDCAIGRADAQWLARGQADGQRHDRVESARNAFQG